MPSSPPNWSVDRETGVRVRQVTSHEAIHHQPFFYVPAYDDSVEWLFFVSHRTGRTEVYGERRADHAIVQLTERADLNEWSIHPAHAGQHVYYTAGAQACRVELDTLREEVLADFGAVPMLAAGMVGAGMGTTALSADDRWWAIPVCGTQESQLYIVDTANGAAECVLEAASIFHPEFHPNDSTLLRYSGPHSARMWVVNRDGSGNRLVYERDSARKEWVVHETWIPGSRDLLAVDWPRGLFRVSIDTGMRSEVTRLNAWHPTVDRAGQRIVADTRNPDRGICLLQLGDGLEPYRVVCQSRATSRGDHWDCDHCPYDDGPVQVYAPQHTHPHPSFSPDGRYVVFTSDASGWPQVMEADLGEL